MYVLLFRLFSVINNYLQTCKTWDVSKLMEGTVIKNEYKLQIHVHIGNSNQIFFFKCAHYCVFYAVFIFC